VPAKVFHADLRSKADHSRLDKLGRLLDRCEYRLALRKGDRVALKMHWGELGNVAYIPPPYVRRLVDKLVEAGCKPFLTDTNTLYRDHRNNAIDHILTALKNGFSTVTTGAPIVIADGLTGHDCVEVAVNGKMIKRAKVAGGIYHADSLLVATHFKGHELYGFGGALKNIGMGCTTPSGKQILHSDIKPGVKKEKCIACGTCVATCPVDAIRIGSEGKAIIEEKLCIGCGECTAVCPVQAIPVNWKTAAKPLMEKTVEYVKAILSNKLRRCIFVNFLINISPECDCYGWNDAPFVADQGILASTDPVAIDQASADLVNSGQVLSTSRLKGKESVDDKIAAATGAKEWRLLLDYAEAIGIGTRSYTMVKVE
jgi:uncharacterized Fe-S center protein